LTEYLDFVRSLSVTQLINEAAFKLLPRREVLAYRPLTLNALLTLKCNVSCPICSIAQLHLTDPSFTMPNDMAFETFRSIIDRFGKHLITVLLSGGEPLLNKEVFKMARFASSKRLLTQLITNGLLVGEHVREILEYTKFINVSLNAVDAEEYHSMHGAPAEEFKSVIDNVARLVGTREKLRKRTRIAVSYVCTKKNLRKIPQFIALAESLRVDEANLRPLISLGLPGSEEGLCLYRDDDEVADLLSSIAPPKGNMKVFLPKLYERSTSQRDCRMPFNFLTVDGDGNVFPCCRIPSFKGCSSIFSSEDVWNSESYRDLRRSLINRALPLPDACVRCGNRFLKRQIGETLMKLRT
jgi:MoaA/NifB/PqqE/SkfB family radical SAM enzyme